MLLQDIRYAVRNLWRAKGFATVAVLCLAFGIGLNTTIFSIVDGVLLKPYPYRDSERIVVIESRNDRREIGGAGVSYPDLEDVRNVRKAFSEVAAMEYRSIALSDSGADPERYAAGAISWDLFPLLGIAPIKGQGFTQEMDRPGAESAVLLSYMVWRDRYQLDPAVIGRRVLLNGAPAVVVGVMPEYFAFPNNQRLWTPLGKSAATTPRDGRSMDVFARLAPGVTIGQARLELETTSGQLAKAYPATNEGWLMEPFTLREMFVPDDVSLVIWMMMASVTLVLFIACSNVANLQLARASGRRREFSVRAALGAGRGRVVRQLLTESVVLSLVSLPLGMLLAEIGTQLISGAMPPDQVPYYITWDVDWRTFLYAVGVAVATAILFGFLPAIQTARTNLVDSLREGGRGGSVRRSRLRNALVVVQVSLALVSLVGALMFVKSFRNLNSYDVGFDPKPLMTMRFYMPGEAYVAPDTKARRVEDVVRRVEALAGVTSAFASNLVPISGGGGGGRAIIDGKPFEAGREPFISFVGVTPHFHRTLGVPIKDGRDFTDAEGWSNQHLAVINDTMARQFWEGRSAMGGRFRLVEGDMQEWFTVIGVARDVKHDDVDPEDVPYPAAYVPYHFQQTFSTGLIVRVEGGEPAAIMPAVRGALRSADPTIPLAVVRSMEEVRSLSFWENGLFGWIFGVTGVVGLLLASIGVYGVLSYAVSQRTAEIGVRMALGAARREVLRLIVGHGVRLAGIGVIVGLVIAPLGTYFGRSLFYNVTWFDPATFAAVAAFLLAVAMVASYVPARRAMRVDPVEALRN